MFRLWLPILLIACASSAHAILPEKRWLHGVVVETGSTPILFVEFQDPIEGLEGDYFRLKGDTPEAAAALADARDGQPLHVLVEFEANYGQLAMGFKGYLFEADVLKIGNASSANPAQTSAQKCERNLYDVFDIPQNLRPKAKH